MNEINASSKLIQSLSKSKHTFPLRELKIKRVNIREIFQRQPRPVTTWKDFFGTMSKTILSTLVTPTSNTLPDTTIMEKVFETNSSFHMK